MATTEEIERRVEAADAARSARRSAAAQRIGELAARRAEIAEQLDDIERALGDVLAECSEVIEISELVAFTDVPAPELTRWQEKRKTQRPKRKKATGGSSGAKNNASLTPATPQTPANGQAPAHRQTSPDDAGTTNTAAGAA
ncbi:hypothetical protein ACPZ19_04805 [Amycolatopsis lurida]